MHDTYKHIVALLTAGACLFGLFGILDHLGYIHGYATVILHESSLGIPLYLTIT